MRKVVDWEAIEKDWRAGIKSKKQMSDDHMVSRAAIDKHFAKLGIDRDLKAQIQAQAQALVARSVAKVTCGDQASQDQIIETNASTSAQVQLNQRMDIRKLNDFVRKLRETIELQEIDVTELPRLVDMTKKLTETMRLAISMEREAYGINAVADVEIKVKGLRDFYGE